MMAEANSRELLAWTAAIVSSHLRSSSLKVADLPPFIKAVHETLRELCGGGSERLAQAPAVPIDQSVTPDYIICLEDGSKLKMLKRHLSTAFGMTPEDYREKWGLPADYPMVAPSYARRRSSLAKRIGLGKRRG